MFRRRTTSPAPAALDGDQAAPADSLARQPGQAGKGRPTPKRSEVERGRRQPFTAPPTNRKAAAATERDRRRAESRRRMDAMRRGEEWALAPRDRGQVRALARDYLDSRKLVVSEYIVFVLIGLVVLIFTFGASRNATVVLYAEVGIIAFIGLESLYYAGRVTRLARQRYPGQGTKGLAWYIAKRSIRLRSSRIPPTRVGRGQQV